MKKSLIIGILFIIAFISLTVYQELINKPVNIHDLTNTASKEENARVYLNATFVAGSITGDNDNGYYVMFGDGVQYIVYMNNKKASEINKFLLDNPDNSYYIEGITKLIPNTLEENGKKFVKEWLDHSHNHNEEEHDSHDITTDEFYQYFGYVYFDYSNSINLIKIITFITGITGIVFIINYVNSKYHFI